MKQIIENVTGLTIEVKQRVNEALAKITGFNKMTTNFAEANWMYAPGSSAHDQITRSDGDGAHADKEPTHTPQQILEMVKQGHVHADLMALYAEDAKTTDKPWELWELFTELGTWVGVGSNPGWCEDLQYRRKPKTHIVHGVEVPDLRFEPNEGEEYYLADPTDRKFTFKYTSTNDSCDTVWAERGLCYENTEEGKKAATLHAKAMLGIDPNTGN